MDNLFIVSGILLVIFILLVMIRIFLSKNVPERVVALDTINTIVIIIMVLLGGFLKKPLYIDIGIVYGILSFIGTLYIARFLERNKGL